LVFQ
jgi:hypothetical protein